MLREDGVGGSVAAAAADGLSLSRGREAQHPYGTVLARAVVKAATRSRRHGMRHVACDMHVSTYHGDLSPMANCVGALDRNGERAAAGTMSDENNG